MYVFSLWLHALNRTPDLLFRFAVGPFVNDALAGVGKLGSGHLTELTQYCTSQKQEIEADIVSARCVSFPSSPQRHSY